MHFASPTLGRALDPALRLQHALDLSFRYLNRRDRTVLEVRRYLEDKRVEPDAIEEALGELQSQGYLDDAGFAQRFAQDKRLLDDWGAERIERRLLVLGVPAEVVHEAVGTQDRTGELQAAAALLARRFPGLSDDPHERQRAHGVLVRKGYEPELAADAIRAHVRGSLD